MSLHKGIVIKMIQLAGFLTSLCPPDPVSSGGISTRCYQKIDHLDINR